MCLLPRSHRVSSTLDSKWHVHSSGSNRATEPTRPVVPQPTEQRHEPAVDLPTTSSMPRRRPRRPKQQPDHDHDHNHDHHVDIEPPGHLPRREAQTCCRSRPASQHASYDAYSVPGVDDPEAFPTLGSMSALASKGPGSGGRRHRGKRGAALARVAEFMAEIVRNARRPRARTVARRPRRRRRRQGPARRHPGARGQPRALAIPPPQDLPWVYGRRPPSTRPTSRLGTEAFKHGASTWLLQGAAQAYNRQDARAAKALEYPRGQTRSSHMREAHRRAAQILYDERNKDAANHRELYVDLHGMSSFLPWDGLTAAGLHAEEAITYLGRILRAHRGRHPSAPALRHHRHGTPLAQRRQGQGRARRARVPRGPALRLARVLGANDHWRHGRRFEIDPGSGSVRPVPPQHRLPPAAAPHMQQQVQQQVQQQAQVQQRQRVVVITPRLSLPINTRRPRPRWRRRQPPRATSAGRAAASRGRRPSRRPPRPGTGVHAAASPARRPAPRRRGRSGARSTTWWPP